MPLIYHIMIFTIYIGIGIIIFFEIKKLKEKKIFISMYKNHYQPACLLDSNKKRIIWINSSFKNQFKTINLESNFSLFNQSIILEKTYVIYNNTNWLIQKTKLNNYFGILFFSTKKIENSIFLELPFAAIIIDKHNFIQEMNSKFKELINISFYENNPKSIQIIIEQLKVCI